VDDFCNECDNCQTFCVHQGRPYRDKPRLYLDAGLFAAEAGNAFRIEGHTVRRREGGRECRLTIGEERLMFETEAARVRLTRDWKVIEATATSPIQARISLRNAAEMAKSGKRRR
jgi:putative selenate reductase